MIGYYLYLIFFISYFLHLPARIPGLDIIRFDLALAGVLLLYAVLVRKKNITEDNNICPITKALLLLIAYIIISIPFVRWPGSVVRFGLISYIKVIVLYFFTVWYVDSEKKLRTVILLFILCQAFRVCEPVFLHVTEGYWGSHAVTVFQGSYKDLNRLSGAPNDIINPNQLAWIIVTTMIFLFYFIKKFSKTVTIVFISLIPICIYGLILTGSRSGLLSFFMAACGVVMLGKQKIRIIILAALIFIPILFFTLPLIDKDLKDRYMSIFDSNVAGHDTVNRRISGLRKTLNSIWDAPLFGHGLSTSLDTNYVFFKGTSRAQISHNLYIEVFQELGLIGFAFFLIYLKRIINTLTLTHRRLLASSSDGSWKFALIRAVQVWIIMDLFYSLSCFGLSSWEWYFMGGLATVSYRLSLGSEMEELEAEF